jgi:predicted DNA-binding transcriptional regulator YafY
MNREDISKELKIDRVLALFLRAVKGESLSVQNLAYEYNVSARSITRDINSLKLFLAENRDILGNTELEYSSTNHCYTLKMDNFLTNKELLAIAKVLIGSRAFNTQDLLELIKKLKMNTSAGDRAKLEKLIHKEMYHYSEVGSDCKSVIDNIWKITECIENRNIISINYYKTNRNWIKYRIKPVSIMFTEYYFYLIAYKCDKTDPDTPHYFRIDRITDITVHREQFSLTKEQNVDEGELRKKSQFMWPGKNRRIRFEFTGPSVQAVLDRIPTAKVISHDDNKCLIEAEVYGDGIKMFLLSQGSWVKVISPDEFVLEMKTEIEKMMSQY